MCVASPIGNSMRRVYRTAVRIPYEKPTLRRQSALHGERIQLVVFRVGCGDINRSRCWHGRAGLPIFTSVRFSRFPLFSRKRCSSCRRNSYIRVSKYILQNNKLLTNPPVALVFASLTPSRTNTLCAKLLLYYSRPRDCMMF